MLKQNFDVSALVQKQADCISVMTYNELGQAADAGFTADKIIQFNYSDLGNDLLEDGLYVTAGPSSPIPSSRTTWSSSSRPR